MCLRLVLCCLSMSSAFDIYDRKGCLPPRPCTSHLPWSPQMLDLDEDLLVWEARIDCFSTETSEKVCVLLKIWAQIPSIPTPRPTRLSTVNNLSLCVLLLNKINCYREHSIKISHNRLDSTQISSHIWLSFWI